MLCAALSPRPIGVLFQRAREVQLHRNRKAERSGGRLQDDKREQLSRTAKARYWCCGRCSCWALGALCRALCARCILARRQAAIAGQHRAQGFDSEDLLLPSRGSASLALPRGLPRLPAAEPTILHDAAVPYAAEPAAPPASRRPDAHAAGQGAEKLDGSSPSPSRPTSVSAGTPRSTSGPSTTSSTAWLEPPRIRRTSSASGAPAARAARSCTRYASSLVCSAGGTLPYCKTGNYRHRY